MRNLSPPALRKRQIALAAAVLLFVLFVFVLAPPLDASADAGGWPTATATFIPTLTPTSFLSTQVIQPTSPLLTFPATPTYTQVVPAFLTEGNNLPRIQAEANTPAASRPFNILSCWPFAVVVLLIAIVGILWLRTRVRQGI